MNDVNRAVVPNPAGSSSPGPAPCGHAPSAGARFMSTPGYRTRRAVTREVSSLGTRRVTWVVSVAMTSP